LKLFLSQARALAQRQSLNWQRTRDGNPSYPYALWTAVGRIITFQVPEICDTSFLVWVGLQQKAGSVSEIHFPSFDDFGLNTLKPTFSLNILYLND